MQVQIGSLRIKELRPGEVILSHKILQRLCGAVAGNTNDFQPLTVKLVIALQQVGHLSAAGAHQVAQKSTSTTLCFQLLLENSSPSIVLPAIKIGLLTNCCCLASLSSCALREGFKVAAYRSCMTSVTRWRSRVSSSGVLVASAIVRVNWVRRMSIELARSSFSTSSTTAVCLLLSSPAASH